MLQDFRVEGKRHVATNDADTEAARHAYPA